MEDSKFCSSAALEYVKYNETLTGINYVVAATKFQAYEIRAVNS